jgi:hypothetical protein
MYSKVSSRAQVGRLSLATLLGAVHYLLFLELVLLVLQLPSCCSTQRLDCVNA